jgi:hypothetical protein
MPKQDPNLAKMLSGKELLIVIIPARATELQEAAVDEDADGAEALRACGVCSSRSGGGGGGGGIGRSG